MARSSKKSKADNKSKVYALLTTFGLVFALAIVIAFIARGYIFSRKSLTFEPTGQLVIKSEPDGAQVSINGKLVGITNDSFRLTPDTYDVSVTKSGYSTWSKRLEIKKEEVSEVTAHIFKPVPSLSAITLNGAFNPVPSHDFTKIAYGVPYDPLSLDEEESGLWVYESVGLPLGFAREPRRITDGDLSQAQWIWSPSGREILLITNMGSFLLNSSTFTPRNQRTNIAFIKDQTLAEWDEELEKKDLAKRRRLPDELNNVLNRVASEIVFSPDEEMILYISTGSATLKTELISPLPGKSTQKEDRDIKTGNMYIYDIKEDRNFLIFEDIADIQILGGFNDENATQKVVWFPTSRHVIHAKDNLIQIIDHDGTNRQDVYNGNYVSPHVFPTLTTNRLMIFTNLGASNQTPNIYSVTIK